MVPEPLKLDEIVNRGPPTLPSPATLAVLQHEEVRRAVVRAKYEAQEEVGIHFLQAFFIATETLPGSSKLVSGRMLDEALTGFLAGLKAELGDGFASNAAAHLIRNLALFLSEA